MQQEKGIVPTFKKFLEMGSHILVLTSGSPMILLKPLMLIIVNFLGFQSGNKYFHIVDTFLSTCSTVNYMLKMEPMVLRALQFSKRHLLLHGFKHFKNNFIYSLMYLLLGVLYDVFGCARAHTDIRVCVCHSACRVLRPAFSASDSLLQHT